MPTKGRSFLRSKFLRSGKQPKFFSTSLPLLDTGTMPKMNLTSLRAGIRPSIVVPWWASLVTRDQTTPPTQCSTPAPFPPCLTWARRRTCNQVGEDNFQIPELDIFVPVMTAQASQLVSFSNHEAFEHDLLMK